MLRSIFFSAVFLGLAPLTFVSPFVGVMLWTWLSIMAPQELIWGFAADIRWGLIIGLITIVAWLISRERKSITPNLVTTLVLFFSLWITITTQFAYVPEAADVKWDWVIRIMVLAIITAPMVTSAVRVHAMIWILCLSVGYFGAKGGLSMVMLTGGGEIVTGTSLGGLGDRNQLALALAMTMPLLYYLYLQSENVWVRRGLLLATVMTVFAILGTYSRGGLLGLIAAAAVMFLKSRTRIVTGTLLAIAIPAALFFMPEEWWGRMSSIAEYEEDASAVGRLTIWTVCLKIGLSSLFGGGFSANEYGHIVMLFDPTVRARAAHSIYFEVLAEHGVVGFAGWLSIMIFSWFNARWLARAPLNKPSLVWAVDLGRMAQASLAAYFVAGAFLTMAYWTAAFVFIVVLAGARQTVAKALKQAEHPLTPRRPARVVPSMGSISSSATLRPTD